MVLASSSLPLATQFVLFLSNRPSIHPCIICLSAIYLSLSMPVHHTDIKYYFLEKTIQRLNVLFKAQTLRNGEKDVMQRAVKLT